jgi:hypothetical protein
VRRRRRRGARVSARASPADRRGSLKAAGLPFVRWTKLPCLRPLRGLQAAGSLPNRRRCWGQGPRRCLAGLPPRQPAVPWQTLAAARTTSRGRRLFPSSLRGSSRPSVIAGAWEDSCGAATASTEAFRKTRILLCGRPRGGSQRAALTVHLCQIGATWLSIYRVSLLPREEHR